MEGRHSGQAPDIDGKVYLSGSGALPGTLRKATFTNCRDYDLVAELDDEDVDVEAARKIPASVAPRRRLNVVSL